MTEMAKPRLEAWYMAASVTDQTAENRQTPNVPVSREDLADFGVLSWYVPIGSSEYPTKAVPWEPNGIQDAKLAAIRSQRGYSYADIITCSEQCLPDYHNKLKAFFQEHIHSDEEVRYILGGSGYFDIRDRQDQWIRISMSAGDLIVLPEGLYHRFTMDSENFTHAMRLFKGVPVWTPINRPADDHISRQRFVDRFSPLDEERTLREFISATLRSFYHHGWCLGSSGAMAALVGAGEHAPMLVTPSGVSKESLKPSDLFLCSRGEWLKIPGGGAGKSMKVSDSAELFSAIFSELKHVRAITHIHSVNSVLAAGPCVGDVLRVTDLEMIKGLGVKNTELLEVPIVGNQATEPELVPSVLAALRAHPTAPAILVREHGVYVFGANVEKAKIAAECLSFVMDVVTREPWRLNRTMVAPTAKRQRVGPSVVLLDIEGTTTPITFVKDKLFPYAAASVGAWLKSAASKDVEAVIASYSAQCQQDGGQVCETKDDVQRLTQEWIKQDRKVAALKDLQGTLWKFGYDTGELKGEMYEDTPTAIANWIEEGKRVAIFSSGSRAAQRLIFAHSDRGDLTRQISAYFDPKATGASKQEKSSYTEVALSLGIDPSDGLFCTDVFGEAKAAKEAGWSAVLLLRPGNAPLPADHGFRNVSSLLDV